MSSPTTASLQCTAPAGCDSVFSTALLASVGSVRSSSMKRIVPSGTLSSPAACAWNVLLFSRLGVGTQPSTRTSIPSRDRAFRSDARLSPPVAESSEKVGNSHQPMM